MAYFTFMASERLTAMNRVKRIVGDHLVKLGDRATEQLSISSGVCSSTIRNVENDHVPLPKTIYKLLKACGMNDMDALALARECSTEAEEESA